MRILIANTRHFPRGGDSTYTFALAEALRSASHEVGFFAMAGSRNEPDPNEDLFVSYIDFREMNRQKSLATGLRVLKRSIFSSEADDKFTRLVARFKPDVCTSAEHPRPSHALDRVHGIAPWSAGGVDDARLQVDVPELALPCRRDWCALRGVPAGAVSLGAGKTLQEGLPSRKRLGRGRGIRALGAWTQEPGALLPVSEPIPG